MKNQRLPLDYDQTIKARFEGSKDFFLKDVIGMDYDRLEDAKTELTYPRGRRADYAYKVFKDGKMQYLAQIEFQNYNDPDIIERMMDCVTGYYREYKAPVRQTVLYFGTKPMNMPDGFPGFSFDYKFEIVDVTALPVDFILQSDRVEAWVFAALAKLEGQDLERSSKQLMEKIRTFTKDRPNFTLDLIESAYVLSRDQQTANSIERYVKENKMAINLEEVKKTHWLFHEGIEQGIEQGIEKKTLEAARNMIARGLSNDFISDILNLPEETIESLRQTNR